MDARQRTLLGSGLVVAGLVGLATFLVVVFIIGEPDVEPPPVTEPEEEPEPEPEPPEPVRGEAELAEVVDLSVTGTGLVHPGTADDAEVGVDDDAVDALVEALTDWLDEHLTDLQEGGDGSVADVGLAGTDGIGDLAGPGEIVDRAAYTMTVGARGAPEWARVAVEVTTEDEATHEAVFVFSGEADPDLMAVEEVA